MKKWYLILIISLIFLITLEVAYALNNVCVNQTDICFDTVQEAVNNATNGQTVVIINNTEYNESVILNRSITLTSNTTPMPTIFSIVNTTINVTVNNATISNLNIKFN